MSPILGIVTGLGFEADVLRASARRVQADLPLIASAGLGSGQAGRAAESLLAQGATHLLSFGLAAGLDPAVPVGAVIAATRVQGIRGAPLACDPLWARRLGDLPQVRAGIIAHAPEILDSAAAKAELRRLSGAMAADMESYDVAVVAAAAQVPCAVLRVISDGAQDALPPAAVIAMDGAGRMKFGPVLAAILRQPGQLGGLIRLGLSAARARGGMRRLADLGLPRGFFVDMLHE